MYMSKNIKTVEEYLKIWMGRSLNNYLEGLPFDDAMHKATKDTADDIEFDLTKEIIDQTLKMIFGKNESD